MSTLNWLLLLATLTMMAGCAESRGLIQSTRTSVRSDVFQQVTSGGEVPKGFADLRVTATLKTHKPGLYSASDIHGTADYMLQLTVDGQTLAVPGTLQEEKLDTKDLEHPESGVGIRYRFGERLRLKPGRHRVVVALPGDRIAVEREITLVDGEVNSLELTPIYGRVSEKKRPSSTRITSFEEGVSGLRLVFNGREM